MTAVKDRPLKVGVENQVADERCEQPTGTNEEKTMISQATKPATFNQGDHVRYVGVKRSELPASQGKEPELVLMPGMEGIILLSSGALHGQGAAAIEPWHCRIQFQNGLQLDINPVSRADFEMACGD